jgi:hypothetical protein
MRFIMILSLASAVAEPAMSAETTTYKYDARGRLIRVERAGTINPGQVSLYLYDKANNRTNMSKVTTP